MKDRFARSRGRRRCWCRCRPSAPYTYAVPDGMEVVPGSIVRVPLGPRQVAGIVWDGAIETGRCQEAPARSSRSSTVRRSTAHMRRFVDWIAQPTRCRRPAWWRACCCARRRPSIRSPGSRGCSARPQQPDRMTAARTRVLELPDDGLAWTRSGLAHAAGVSSTVIDGLRDAGRFRDRDDPAAAGGRSTRPRLCRSPT